MNVMIPETIRYIRGCVPGAREVMRVTAWTTVYDKIWVCKFLETPISLFSLRARLEVCSSENLFCRLGVIILADVTNIYHSQHVHYNNLRHLY